MSEARKAIARGSKSFFLASLFFRSSMRGDVWRLYHWCRHCDDTVDLKGASGAAAGLSHVHAQTLAALEGREVPPVFAGMGAVCRAHAIAPEYPLELLAGFAKDVHGADYLSLRDVEEYAYQVAGVIGVMMASIMGVRAAEARCYAIAMGNAMQLTNIARDVAEDYARGRIYLPRQWLMEEGVFSVESLLAPERRDGVYRVVLKVLDRADELYRAGYEGLRFLPFRAAVAVAAAGEIYSRIGTTIREEGPQVLDRRVIVPWYVKLRLALKGVGRAIRSRL